MEGWVVQPSRACGMYVSLYGTEGQALGPVCAVRLSRLFHCFSEEERYSCRHH